jgi:phosphatidylserine decarboxylase
MFAAQYAGKEIVVTGLAGAAATAACAYWATPWTVVPIALTAGLLAFYRSPRRAVVREAEAVVSPADGKIVEITPEAEVEGLPGPALRFTIFLRIYDVHVNRSPCAGRVLSVEYRPGKFFNALRPQASQYNESNILMLAPQPPLPGPVRIRQIAGVLARRIVCTARPGTVLESGEPFGMIKLGSRTELCLPAAARWQVLVKGGDVVRAGSTVLARLNPSGPSKSTG